MLNGLFNPFELRGMTIKNRCVVSPMVTNYCTRDGYPTEKFLAYHEARAKGGWGLIITENYAVDPIGRGFKYVPGLWDDRQIEGHKELPSRVHKYGSVILAQIYHCGRQTSVPVINATPVAPSPIPCPICKDMPKELSVDEIQIIAEKFADTAYRAKNCGFDGVEIHGAHGYLIAQFMSHYTNKRVDNYGGSLQNRMRFALEIVKNIRDKCGEDFIIGFRISVEEFVEGGRTTQDTIAIVKMLEASGVDIIHTTVGTYVSGDTVIPPSYVKHAWIADLAAEVKNACSIPVIAVGRINDPHLANSVIESGKADFTAMGRASLIDPDLPNKAMEGRFDDIRQCIGCNYGCATLQGSNNPAKCSLNPELGSEYKGLPEKASISKKVAVVGAGPAGLEAAIYAARAGHNVIVLEKNSRAGGQLYLASIPPCKGEISAFIQWQLTALGKLGVKIQYNAEVSSDYFSEQEFDTIIVATGAKPTKLSVSGVDLPHVLTANSVLEGTCNVGQNVVVIGGGQVGAETAHFLGVQLKNVTLVEMLPDIVPNEASAPRLHLIRSLENRKVRVMTNTSVQEIKAKSVVLRTADNVVEISADTVVVAVGSTPDDSLANQLVKKGLPVKVIGDAREVGIILDATEQGYQIASLL